MSGNFGWLREFVNIINQRHAASHLNFSSSIYQTRSIHFYETDWTFSRAISSGDGIGLDEVFAPEAGAFNDNDLGVVQETIQKRRGESRVVVEDLRPAFERSVCS